MNDLRVSPEVVLSLSADGLRALLDAFGAIPGVRAGAEARTIARAVWEGRAGQRLARALSHVARFGSAAGRRAIVEAANATRDARAERWLGEAPLDVAAELVVARAAAKGKARRAAARLLALATLRLERELPECASYELLVDALPPDFDQRLDGEAWRRDGKDGAVDLAVFVQLPASCLLEGGARRVARATAVDLVRVSADRARAALTLSQPESLPRYAAALGLSPRPSFTLRPFHELAPFSRARLPPGVRGVTVVAVRWRTPSGARHESRAFDLLEEPPPAARAGYVDRATLRVDLAESARPVDVFLELPHRMELGDPFFAKEVRALLEAAGVLAPGVAKDDAWSLAPFVHGEWRWRAVLGDEAFARMVEFGLLARTTAPHVATEGARGLGATYVVRDVPGEPGMQYALAEDRSVPARLVGAEERAALRLDTAKLAARMKKDLGAEGGGELRAEGVLDLGAVALPEGKLRFFALVASPAKGWAAAARRACGMGTTPVVLQPAGRDAVRELLAIELSLHEQLGAAPITRAVAHAAEALGVALEPWRRATEEVVVDPVAERAWVRGVEVALSDKPFRMLLLLARNAGRTIPTKEIGAHVSRSEYPDVAARRTKAELEKQVAKSLGEPIELVVAEGRKGYRLALSARVL